MKRILILTGTMLAACMILFPRMDAVCGDDCCGKCDKKLEKCFEVLQQKLLSECHNSCSRSYPKGGDDYDSCLDECYQRVDEEINSDDNPCTSQYVTCTKKCGGCPE